MNGWEAPSKEQNCELIKKCFPFYRRESLNISPEGFQNVTSNHWAYFPFFYFPSWSLHYTLPPLSTGWWEHLFGLRTLDQGTWMFDPFLTPYMKATSVWSKYPNFKNHLFILGFPFFFSVQGSQINKNLTGYFKWNIYRVKSKGWVIGY